MTQTKHKILIVDASSSFPEKISQELDPHRYQVLSSLGTLDAIKQIALDPPSLIVLDFDSPESAGVEFCRNLKLNIRFRNIPVLLLADEKQDTLITISLEAGADSYVSKTEDIKVIARRAEALIRFHVKFGSMIDLAGSQDNYLLTMQGKILLIVDDDATYLNTMKPAMQSYGYMVKTAQSGELALEYLKKDKADLVMLDYLMPDLDGVDICRAVRKMKGLKDLPIVIVSSSHEVVDKITCLEAGADDYVEKNTPVNLLALQLHAIIRKKYIQNETNRLRARLKKVTKTAVDAHLEKDLQKKYADQLADKNQHLEILYKELAEKNEALKKLDSLKSDFISTVSHELRTPLSIINIAITNLDSGVVGEMTEKQGSVVSIARKNVERLSRLISDLLDLSRLESGRVQLKKSRMTVKDYLAESVDFFITKAEENHIDLTLEVQNELPAIFADVEMFHQVINNLLSNALRFAKSRIQVKAELVHESVDGRSESAFVQFSVIDDGPGIQQDSIQQLFNKFIQINRPKGGAGYKGTGLGLTICKEIVTQHNGHIDVISKPGQGAHFYFLLPIHDENTIFLSTIRDSLTQADKANTTMSFIAIQIENIETLYQVCPEKEINRFYQQLELVIREKVLRRADKISSNVQQGLMVVHIETNRKGCIVIKERIQKLLKEVVFEVSEVVHPVHFSLGVALYPKEGTSPKELLEVAAANSQKKKLLLIDDEKNLLDIISILSQTNDFLIEISMDGDSGVRLAQSYKPDLIVLDLFMTGMDGWSVCKLLRENQATADVPIVLLVDSIDAALKNKAQSIHAELYTKPFDQQQFVKYLKKLLTTPK